MGETLPLSLKAICWSIWLAFSCIVLAFSSGLRPNKAAWPHKSGYGPLVSWRGGTLHCNCNWNQSVTTHSVSIVWPKWAQLLQQCSHSPLSSLGPGRARTAPFVCGAPGHPSSFWPHYRLCTHLHQRTTKSRLMRLRVPFLETPVIEWQLTRPKSTATVSLWPLTQQEQPARDHLKDD